MDATLHALAECTPACSKLGIETKEVKYEMETVGIKFTTVDITHSQSRVAELFFASLKEPIKGTNSIIQIVCHLSAFFIRKTAKPTNRS